MPLRLRDKDKLMAIRGDMMHQVREDIVYDLVVEGALTMDHYKELWGEHYATNPEGKHPLHTEDCYEILAEDLNSLRPLIRVLLRCGYGDLAAELQKRNPSSSEPFLPGWSSIESDTESMGDPFEPYTPLRSPIEKEVDRLKRLEKQMQAAQEEDELLRQKLDAAAEDVGDEGDDASVMEPKEDTLVGSSNRPEQSIGLSSEIEKTAREREYPEQGKDPMAGPYRKRPRSQIQAVSDTSTMVEEPNSEDQTTWGGSGTTGQQSLHSRNASETLTAAELEIINGAVEPALGEHAQNQDYGKSEVKPLSAKDGDTEIADRIQHKAADEDGSLKVVPGTGGVHKPGSTSDQSTNGVQHMLSPSDDAGLLQADHETGLVLEPGSTNDQGTTGNQQMLSLMDETSVLQSGHAAGRINEPGYTNDQTTAGISLLPSHEESLFQVDPETGLVLEPGSTNDQGTTGNQQVLSLMDETSALQSGHAAGRINEPGYTNDQTTAGMSLSPSHEASLFQVDPETGLVLESGSTNGQGTIGNQHMLSPTYEAGLLQVDPETGLVLEPGSTNDQGTTGNQRMLSLMDETSALQSGHASGQINEPDYTNGQTTAGMSLSPSHEASLFQVDPETGLVLESGSTNGQGTTGNQHMLSPTDEAGLLQADPETGLVLEPGSTTEVNSEGDIGINISTADSSLNGVLAFNALINTVRDSLAANSESTTPAPNQLTATGAAGKLQGNNDENNIESDMITGHDANVTGLEQDVSLGRDKDQMKGENSRVKNEIRHHSVNAGVAGIFAQAQAVGQAMVSDNFQTNAVENSSSDLGNDQGDKRDHAHGDKYSESTTSAPNQLTATGRAEKLQDNNGQNIENDMTVGHDPNVAGLEQSVSLGEEKGENHGVNNEMRHYSVDAEVAEAITQAQAVGQAMVSDNFQTNAVENSSSDLGNDQGDKTDHAHGDKYSESTTSPNQLTATGTAEKLQDNNGQNIVNDMTLGHDPNVAGLEQSVSLGEEKGENHGVNNEMRHYSVDAEVAEAITQAQAVGQSMITNNFQTNSVENSSSDLEHEQGDKTDIAHGDKYSELTTFAPNQLTATGASEKLQDNNGQNVENDMTTGHDANVAGLEQTVSLDEEKGENHGVKNEMQNYSVDAGVVEAITQAQAVGQSMITNNFQTNPVENTANDRNLGNEQGENLGRVHDGGYSEGSNPSDDTEMSVAESVSGKPTDSKEYIRNYLRQVLSKEDSQSDEASQAAGTDELTKKADNNAHSSAYMKSDAEHSSDDGGESVAGPGVMTTTDLDTRGRLTSGDVLTESGSAVSNELDQNIDWANLQNAAGQEVNSDGTQKHVANGSSEISLRNELGNNGNQTLHDSLIGHAEHGHSGNPTVSKDLTQVLTVCQSVSDDSPSHSPKTASGQKLSQGQEIGQSQAIHDDPYAKSNVEGANMSSGKSIVQATLPNQSVSQTTTDTDNSFETGESKRISNEIDTEKELGQNAGQVIADSIAEVSSSDVGADLATQGQATKTISGQGSTIVANSGMDSNIGKEKHEKPEDQVVPESKIHGEKLGLLAEAVMLSDQNNDQIVPGSNIEGEQLSLVADAVVLKEADTETEEEKGFFSRIFKSKSRKKSNSQNETKDAQADSSDQSKESDQKLSSSGKSNEMENSEKDKSISSKTSGGQTENEIPPADPSDNQLRYGELKSEEVKNVSTSGGIRRRSTTGSLTSPPPDPKPALDTDDLAKDSKDTENLSGDEDDDDDMKLKEKSVFLNTPIPSLDEKKLTDDEEDELIPRRRKITLKSWCKTHCCVCCNIL